MLRPTGPRRPDPEAGGETCATWPRPCRPLPAARWEFPEPDSCGHCDRWPCVCPPVVGDPRRPPIEACACGGVIVAASRHLPAVVAAIGQHADTARHRAWRQK